MIWGAIISTVGGALISRKSNKSADKAADSANYAANMQADIAQDQWDRYKNVFAPLEQEMVSDARDSASDWEYARAASQASADVGAQYGKAVDRLNRIPGMDPSSAMYGHSIAGLEMDRAAADATAQNVARAGVDTLSYQKKNDALSLGKGLPANAVSGMSNAASAYGNIASTQSQNAANQATAFGTLTNRVVNGLQTSGWLGGGTQQRTTAGPAYNSAPGLDPFFGN